MNRTLLGAFAVLAVAISLSYASDTRAQDCNLPGGTENVAYAWGANYAGQLGDGTNDQRNGAVRVQNLSGVLSVAAGGGHSLALKNDCTVWAWGLNFYGQLGDGTMGLGNDRSTPVQVQNLSGVTAIAGGNLHSLALKNDGTVWAWGFNRFGQLGDGTTMDRSTPVQVQNLSGVIAIATGNSHHNLVVKSDGTVWAWGQNSNGQLGDGTTIERHTPVQVQNLDGVTAVARGFLHSLALKNDGTVWAWGVNGALGDGSTMERHTPIQVGRSLHGIPFFLREVKAIAAGNFYSLAVKNDGTVWAWGDNSFGDLGVPRSRLFTTPVPVQADPHISEVRAIAAGSYHNLALRSHAIVQAWGENDHGELGNGTADTNEHGFPTQVVGLVENLSEVRAIAAAGLHSLAAGPSSTLLTVRKFLVHPDQNHLRRFNIMIDGVVVAADINAGDTAQHVSPGIHTVSEAGGTDTSLSDFTTVIGGDCAADGTVSLALGDKKTCTITNYDLSGGCLPAAICCEPGQGIQGCTRCVAPGQECR